MDGHSAPLPDGRLVATYMTDADLWVRARGGVVQRWSAGLKSSSHTSARIAGFAAPGSVSVFPAFSSALVDGSGRDWVAVGDAAISVDPLSGQGIHYALRSAVRAAEAIELRLGGALDALARLRLEIPETFARYLVAQRAQYARETRWPDTPFWARRREPAGV